MTALKFIIVILSVGLVNFFWPKLLPDIQSLNELKFAFFIPLSVAVILVSLIFMFYPRMPILIVSCVLYFLVLLGFMFVGMASGGSPDLFVSKLGACLYLSGLIFSMELFGVAYLFRNFLTH